MQTELIIIYVLMGEIVATICWTAYLRQRSLLRISSEPPELPYSGVTAPRKRELRLSGDMTCLRP